MRSTRSIVRLVLISLAACGTLDRAAAQVVYEFQPTEGIHAWNDPNNWLGDDTFVFVPDISAAPGDSALLSTEATAEIDDPAPTVGQLLVDDGTVVINDDGSLATAVSAGTTGAVILARPGARLEVRDAGSLTVGTVFSSVGQFHVYGDAANIDVTGDLLMSTSVLGAHIVGSNHAVVAAQGAADLSGTLEVEISGATPTLGTSWDLVTAAGGIDRMFQEVVVTDAPELTRGLQYRAVQNGNTAALEVGNSLVVTLNRQTGAVSIENPVGSSFTLASYAIQSPAGVLAPGSAISLNDVPGAGTGWLGSPATAQLLAEVKPDSTFNIGIGGSISLGNALTPGIVPAEENIAFDFTTTDGNVYEGIVEYTGAVNDFVLFVDPSDGSAALGNLSGFITPPDVTGYAILSPSEQLLAGSWTTLEGSGEAGAGWDAAPGLPGALAETNLEQSYGFDFGTIIDLGQIFTPSGEQDLQFSYTVAGETAEFSGSVVYGTIPDAPELTPGDFNGDNHVNGIDFLLLQRGFPDPRDAADFAAWQANYGVSPLSGPAATAPEPSAAWLLASAVGLLAGVRLRRGKVCADAMP